MYRIFYSIDQVFDEDYTHHEKPEFLSVDHWYSFHLFIPITSFDSLHIRLNIYTIILFMYYHVWTFICVIVVIVDSLK